MDNILTLDATFERLTTKTLEETEMLEIVANLTRGGYYTRAEELSKSFYNTVALMLVGRNI